MNKEELRYMESKWDELSLGQVVKLNLARLYDYLQVKQQNCISIPSYGEYESEYLKLTIKPEIDDDTNCEYADYEICDKQTGTYCGSMSINYPAYSGTVKEIDRENGLIVITIPADWLDNPFLPEEERIKETDVKFTKEEFLYVASIYIHGGKDIVAAWTINNCRTTEW